MQSTFCVSPPDYRTIQIKEHPYVNQQPVPPASGRFSLSAGTHILAMVLMLMDHLWTLLPAQDWLTCAGRLAFPIFAFMAVEGYFHTPASEIRPAACCCCRAPSAVLSLMYGGTWFYPVYQNVIWTLLLGLLGIHLMETVRKNNKHGCICSPPCLLC